MPGWLHLYRVSSGPPAARRYGDSPRTGRLRRGHRPHARQANVADEQEYDINLDDKFGSLRVIDLPAEIAAHEPWFNQTLTTVNDAVVRLGVIPTGDAAG